MVMGLLLFVGAIFMIRSDTPANALPIPPYFGMNGDPAFLILDVNHAPVFIALLNQIAFVVGQPQIHFLQDVAKRCNDPIHQLRQTFALRPPKYSRHSPYQQ